MKKRYCAAMLAILGVSTLTVGCSSTNDVSLDAVSRRLTPEVMTLNERPADVKKNIAYTKNVNYRMMFEDLGRVWLLDHPSRLNTIEVIQTSGKPR